MSLLTDIAADTTSQTLQTQTDTTSQGGPDGNSHAASQSQEPAATRWTVPEDYRTQEAVRKFLDDKGTLDPAVLLKSHINLESKLGRDKIALPTQDSEWDEVYDRLGRPAAPEGYTYKAPTDLPEGVTVNADVEKYWRAAAHANGLSDKQFNGLAKLFLDAQGQSVAGWTAAQNEARAKVEGDLKREWGQAYDQNVQAAKIAMKEYADADLLKVMDESGLGNDPRMVKVFAKIGAELLGDDKLKGTGADGGKLTPAQVQAKISEFRTTHEKALFNSEHPEHNRLVKELEALHRMVVV